MEAVWCEEDVILEDACGVKEVYCCKYSFNKLRKNIRFR